jgi:hypothetical protein
MGLVEAGSLGVVGIVFRKTGWAAKNIKFFQGIPLYNLWVYSYRLQQPLQISVMAPALYSGED